ncbi:ScyD/ScyE family protein [Arthrobacter sp. NPDC058192]|uniref:ScyD/ScyE family protein n=1 Tax=Arthrobacter sp. NPDC058192 TaxID=3346372 RepID=UPI0036EE1650
MRKDLSLLAAAATVAAFLSAGPSAVVAANGPPTTLASGLGGPLHLSAGEHGTVTVSEEFVGRLTRMDAHGTKKVLYENAHWDVAGNAQQGSTTYFVESQGAGPMDARPLVGHVRSIDEDGHQRTFGDFAALETQHNADKDAHYGFHNLPADCAAQLPPQVPAASGGDVDSHPYGMTVSGRTIYVADAGANSVVSVDVRTGRTRTVAVLPPRPFKITAEAAAASHLPACTVGRTYAFEPVPTDVAQGPGDWLYVSTLPGGPEDPALGARGAVFKVDPDNGRVKLLADQVMSPTGLAVGDDGDIYVASLFGKGVLKIDRHSGKQSVVLSAALTADVDLAGSTLYATVNALPSEGAAPGPPNGKVASSDVGHGSHDD